MSLTNTLSAMLRDGLSSQTVDRIAAGARSAGGNVEQTLTGFLGADRVAQAKSYVTEKQAGGLTGAQIGGAGALLGALFGGGVGGAVKGGALAVLGSLAYNAYQAHREGAATDAAPVAPPAPSQIAAMTAPQVERTVLRAMIAASMADGVLDEAETAKLMDRIGPDADADDRAFVQAELDAPAAPEAIAAEVSSPEVATEVYLASLLVIDADTPQEMAHLRKLAAALGLQDDIVARLHRMTGAPPL